MHKLPNLYRNRLGTYYLRIKINGREIKRSLGTKEPALAKKAALAFALAKAGGTIALVDRAAGGGPCADHDRKQIETFSFAGSAKNFGSAVVPMEVPTPRPSAMLNLPAILSKFDVVLPNGIKLMGIDDDIEARRAATFLRDVLSTAGSGERDYTAALDDAAQAARMVSASHAPAAGKSKPFSKVAAMYMAEKQLDNGRKTLDDKQATFDTFVELFGDMDFNTIAAEQAVAYKQRLLAQVLSIVRINSKLSHLKELFRWAINNGMRHTGNPFEAMRVSTKGKIKQLTKSYIPFTDEDLKAIFDPARAHHWL
ncbi:hypothetical protein [uncultured Piscinibacter sp.]|uniref:hypothetical protein n=1 Tax=uncultured Piscinibacter sp. TaxID=1131835 RepID=UPI0026176E41|nr:hypothetical protein [uncultured Piscinibacter sp.]